MKIQPKTEKEIKEMNLVPEGIYDFEIFRAEEKISKNQNEMIVLGLKLFKDNGAYIMIDDYLLESGAAKLYGACAACGLLDIYNSGDLAASDFLDKTGKANVSIQADKTGNYPDKNVIKSYVKPSGEKNNPAVNLSDLDDEIPF